MSTSTSKNSKVGGGDPIIIDSINLVTSESSEEDDITVADPPPLYDLVYKDRSNNLLEEMEELHNKKHEKYVEGLDKLKLALNNELTNNNLKIKMDSERIEKEYEKSCQKIKEEIEKQSEDLKETLIKELNEKKKNILTEKEFMDLQTDSVDEIPLSTRKLRRRPYDPVVPVIQERRRRLPPLTSNYYLLHEREIEEDVKAIQEILNSEVPTSKPELLQSSSTDLDPPKINDSETVIFNIKVESGKLLYDKRWYHRGQPIFVEETSMEKFPAIISSIGKETIWVKKTLDNSKFRINISCLSTGKISITRRAAI